MATEKAEAPEGFTRAAAPSTDNSDDFDTEWIDRPMLGDMIQGTFLNAKENCGQYDTTVIEARLTQPAGDFDEGALVCFWSTNGIDAAIEENDVTRGEEICLVCDDTWTDDGQEKRSYELYVKGGN